MKTTQIKPADVKRQWHLIDAKGQVLGKMAVEIARKLMGKHKVSFTPHVDSGDYVVVINAAEINVSTKKLNDKKYYTHSGIPMGFKELSMAQVMDRDPARVIERAIKGMLPRNKQHARRMARLKVFANAEHGYMDKFVVKKGE